MLQDVGQCLLDDAVEGSLRLRRQALPIIEIRLHVHADLALLEDRVAKTFERGHETEVVQRSRAQLHREPPDILQRRDHELAELGEAGAAVVGLDTLLERLQAEQDRRECLPGLVVELASQASALDLLCLDDTTDGVAAHALGQVDCGRRTRGERLGQSYVVVEEARRRAELVVSDDDAHRPTAHQERNVESRRDAHSASGLLIDLRIVQHRVDPLAVPPLQDAARLRAAELERHPDQAVCIRAFSVGGSDAQRVGAGVAERDEHEPGLDETSQPPRDQAEQWLELEFARECLSDLVHGLEVPKPARRRLVQARVLDRYRGLRGQELSQLLVLIGEVAPAELLG